MNEHSTRVVIDESDRAAQAHQEYMSEVQQLVDEQVKALFAMLATGAMRAGEGRPGGANPIVKQQDHTFSASNGERTITAEVEDVTDLPEGSDRAAAFADGQAHCTVRAGNTVIAEWVLHRSGAGDNVLYTWADAQTGKALDEADVTSVMQPLYA